MIEAEISGAKVMKLPPVLLNVMPEICPACEAGRWLHLGLPFFREMWFIEYSLLSLKVVGCNNYFRFTPTIVQLVFLLEWENTVAAASVA